MVLPGDYSFREVQWLRTALRIAQVGDRDSLVTPWKALSQIYFMKFIREPLGQGAPIGGSQLGRE